MAVGEFYDVPEIYLRTATPFKFAACIDGRRSTKKANWAGDRLDLAGMWPEDLPPCFLSVGESISFRKGWETEHGSWAPRESYASRSFRARVAPCWVRTELVFHPKKSMEYSIVMMLYNTIVRNSTGWMEVEEDISLCCVFRVLKEKGNGVVRSEAPSVPPPSESEYADLSYSEAEAFCNSYSFYSVYPNTKVKHNAMEYWNPYSIDPSGGPPKRQRPNSRPVGGSIAWENFVRLYTKDSKETKVSYAVCRHCGRLMSVKDGSTSSLPRHTKSCQYNSADHTNGPTTV